MWFHIFQDSKDDEPKDEDLSPEATGPTEARSRDSISLQRMASVEEISRAMAKAEKSRPRRKRQESETMQNWKKDFEERLKKKDELESEAIKQLRAQADSEKSQWYVVKSTRPTFQGKVVSAFAVSRFTHYP